MRRVDRPIRILHVVGGMDTGGIETWLMHLLRQLDRTRYHFDFLTHTTKPCFYDEEIRSLGSRILPCPRHMRPWRYAPRFRRILKDNGPYDVVHSHVHHFSGLPLMLARYTGVSARIAHSHNDTSPSDSRARVWRRLYLAGFQRLIRRHATVGLACSAPAATALYGEAWQQDPRWHLLYCGIDLKPFTEPIDPGAVRQELSMPADALVLGHVGRFAEQKNHTLLIDIFAEFAKRDSNAVLLLLGDGPLRSSIEQKVRHLGLGERVIFAGVRADIPRLMRGAMDVLLLPSLHEGLPVTGIEAQAAGLPLVLSDVITRELDVVQPLVHRVSLDAPVMQWCDVIEKATVHAPVSAETRLRLIREAELSIDGGLARLLRCYGRPGQWLPGPGESTFGSRSGHGARVSCPNVFAVPAEYDGK